jgi:hypothetical protein
MKPWWLLVLLILVRPLGAQAPLGLPSVPRPAPAAPLALSPGERLTYRVTYGGITAGEIRMEAREVTQDGKPRLVITTTTSTKGLARTLLKFDAKAESFFDPATGRLQNLTERSDQRGEIKEHAVTFDYAKAIARYTVPQAEPRELPMPAGSPVDLITSLLATRNWTLKPGETQDALVLWDDDFYELTIHAEQFEELKTPMGRFKTLLLSPKMEKTPPKGTFKRGNTVRVWIEQDDPRHLPVRFELEFRFGAGIATLVDYTPPTGAPPAPVK